MAQTIVKSFAAGLLGSYLESKFEPAAILGLAGEGPAGLPRAYGITPVILSGMSFWVLLHGFLVVNTARSKYTKQAKTDGEKDVEERYGYPNLYAQGTSKNVRAFNCVQRSHQHIFETFPQICLMSMVGAVYYPITTAATLTSYCIGRYTMSQGYANGDGDASKRYSSALAMFNWYGFLSTLVVAAVSGVSIMTGNPLI